MRSIAWRIGAAALLVAAVVTGVTSWLAWFR
jgi:hypothetical protein